MQARYQVTLSHYGHELSQEGFTSFTEALERVKALRAKHGPFDGRRGYFIHIENTELAEGDVQGEGVRYFDGLTQDEVELLFKMDGETE